jgi:hypothetical protein
MFQDKVILLHQMDHHLHHQFQHLHHHYQEVEEVELV